MKRLVLVIFILFLALLSQFSVKAIGKESASEHIGHHGRGPDVENDMVFIPGGEFTMGSTTAEVEDITKKFGSKRPLTQRPVKWNLLSER